MACSVAGHVTGRAWPRHTRRPDYLLLQHIINNCRGTPLFILLHVKLKFACERARRPLQRRDLKRTSIQTPTRWRMHEVSSRTGDNC